MDVRTEEQVFSSAGCRVELHEACGMPDSCECPCHYGNPES